MKLDDSRRSDNVEDDRGSGGGIGGSGFTGLHLGLAGTAVVVVIGYFLGISPSTMLALINGDTQSTSVPTTAQAPQRSTVGATPGNNGGQQVAADPQVDFVRAVLGETEDVWGAYFKNMGKTYSPPKLELFTRSVNSACGFASAASGPFYCPDDRKVYIDLGFFNQLATQLGAPGDFARAYVIAHEVGHHVQNLLGITDKASDAEQRAGRVGANKVSVTIELQADCFAGVWANQANALHHILDSGDVEQGLRAASSVGDDTLQRAAQGSVVPDSFTHGSSAQRVRWFRRGFDAGKIEACDTFNAGAAL